MNPNVCVSRHWFYINHAITLCSFSQRSIWFVCVKVSQTCQDGSKEGRDSFLFGATRALKLPEDKPAIFLLGFISIRTSMCGMNNEHPTTGYLHTSHTILRGLIVDNGCLHASAFPELLLSPNSREPLTPPPPAPPFFILCILFIILSLKDFKSSVERGQELLPRPLRAVCSFNSFFHCNTNTGHDTQPH